MKENIVSKRIIICPECKGYGYKKFMREGKVYGEPTEFEVKHFCSLCKSSGRVLETVVEKVTVASEVKFESFWP